MRRFFVKNLLFVIFINLLVKPVWILLIDRTVQNRVGHADYGTYQALLNLGMIFNIMLDFGLTYYNTRLVSGAPTKLRTLFPAMLSARLLLIVAYTIIMFAAAIILGYAERELLLLFGVIFIQAFASLMQFIRSNVSAIQKFKWEAFLSVTDRLLMIIICGVLLYTPQYAEDFKIEWFIGTQVLCYAIAVVIGYITLKKLTRASFTFTFEYKEVLKVIRQSLPYASLVFLMAVHMRVDTVLVERISGPESKTYAGLYAAAFRLLDVGNMFGLMFAGMLLPLFGRMLARKNDVQPVVRLCVNLLLPASVTVASVAVFYGEEIMNVLYADTTAMSGTVLAWLLSTFPAYCMMYIFSTLLTANENLQLLNKVAIAGVIINLTMNFLLIPQLKAEGAAIAAFTTQNILAVCYIAFASTKLNLPKDIKWISAHISFIIIAIITGFISIKVTTGISWLYGLGLLLLTAAIFIILFRFVSLRSVRRIFE